MPEHHPDPQTLARYMEGQLSADERREVERHLAACSACQTAASAHYDPVFDRVFGAAPGEISAILQEVDTAARLLADLLGRPASERQGMVEGEVRFHALLLCDLLCKKSRAAWFQDPASAVELAGLAVAVAERLDPGHYGAMRVEDARALAWAHLGNSWRIASDLRRAEESLGRAEEHFQRSDGDAYTEAEILSFKASLRTSQCRFDEAVRLLDDVIAIYREARDKHLEGKALIMKGTAHGHAGRWGEAVRLIRKGLTLIDLVEEPRLQVSARHNLIWFLSDSGHPQEAQEDIEKTRQLYLELGEPTNLVRLRWLEGRVARELGRLDEAEAALRSARDAFLERNIGFDAARVSLDLAMVYAILGEREALKQLAAEMVPIFESRDVHEEALAALLLFRQAAEAEEVTLDLLHQMATYFQRSRQNPELRFEAGKARTA